MTETKTILQWLLESIWIDENADTTSFEYLADLKSNFFIEITEIGSIRNIKYKVNNAGQVEVFNDDRYDEHTEYEITIGVGREWQVLREGHPIYNALIELFFSHKGTTLGDVDEILATEFEV